VTVRPTCSIVTPSYNMLGYLQRNIASVADQQLSQTGTQTLAAEHIVVDGCSTDGTVAWLDQVVPSSGLRTIVARDRGMYDAINKGLRLATGEILAYLSCDEQYLPGTLAAIESYFRQHPEVDVVFGDTLVVRPDGSLVCFRKAYPPIWPFMATGGGLYNFPSSMFFRRRVIDNGEFFDASLKDVGDAEFVIRLLRKGYRMAVMRRYLSAFTLTGTNRGQKGAVREEAARFDATLPRWIKTLRLPLNAARLLLKAVSGAYVQHAPLCYEIYLSGSDARRTMFVSAHPSPRWRLS
jgi:glycosyltransferase involved in cell wall biosynthesis